MNLKIMKMLDVLVNDVVLVFFNFWNFSIVFNLIVYNID